jgi:hypothetical protein
MSGRREQAARVIRRRLEHQRAPHLIVLQPWTARGRNGMPIWFGIPGDRPPTQEELISAIVAAGFTREVAIAAAERELKKLTPKPTDNSVA